MDNEITVAEAKKLKLFIRASFHRAITMNHKIPDKEANELLDLFEHLTIQLDNDK